MDIPQFIHLLVDGYLDCFHVLAIITNAAMYTYAQIFARCMFSLLLGIYLGMESLSHVITLV